MKTLEEKMRQPYLRLDLGCGLNTMQPHDDWVHVDFDRAEHIDVVCDWRKLPFPDGVFDECHSSETIEHIPRFQIDTLKEWNRVMKVGCVFWGTTPNLAYVIKAAYLKLKDDDWVRRNMYGDQAGYPHQHYHLYTAKTLTELLTQFGFGDIVIDSFGGNPKPEDWPWLSWKCKKARSV